MVNDNPATTMINLGVSDTVRIGSFAGLWCNASGTLVTKDADGNIATFQVVQGQVVPCSPVFIMAASTCTSYVGLSNTR